MPWLSSYKIGFGGERIKWTCVFKLIVRGIGMLTQVGKLNSCLSALWCTRPVSLYFIFIKPSVQRDNLIQTMFVHFR